MKRWEHFSNEELLSILQKSKTYREVLNSLGYASTSRTSIVKEIEQKIGYTMTRTNRKTSNEELIGKQYGDLKVLIIDEEKSNNKKRIWVSAQCKCGAIISVSLNALKTGNTKSCGCRRFHENLAGQHFGEWTVLSYAYTNIDSKGNKNKIFWYCQCSCGTTRTVLGEYLRNGKSKSCGCKQGTFVKEKLLKDLTGRKFGKLTALERDDSKQIRNKTYWKCICDCGKITYVQTAMLNNGNTSSCGCRRNSFGEEQIKQILEENHINYLKEFSFDDLCGDNKKLRFDFAIFVNDELKYLIECQGPQHFSSVNYFGGNNIFLKQQRYDILKQQYCQKHKIPLILIDFKKNRKINTYEVIKEDLLC